MLRRQGIFGMQLPKPLTRSQSKTSLVLRSLPLVVLVIGLLSCHTIHAQTIEENLRNNLRILHSIQDNHKFTDADRQFTLAMTNSDNLTGRHAASIILTAACHNNLYSSQDLTKMLEEKAIKAQRNEPVLYLVEYANLLAMGRDTEDKYSRQWDKIKSEKAPIDVLSPDEKAFLIEVLPLPSRNDAGLGGGLLVMKRGMDVASIKWTKNKLESQIKMSSGNYRKWWTFVVHVVEGRNPAAKHS